jgi:hypothetical protein
MRSPSRDGPSSYQIYLLTTKDLKGMSGGDASAGQYVVARILIAYRNCVVNTGLSEKGESHLKGGTLMTKLGLITCAVIFG